MPAPLLWSFLPRDAFNGVLTLCDDGAVPGSFELLLKNFNFNSVLPASCFIVIWFLITFYMESVVLFLMHFYESANSLGMTLWTMKNSI